MRLNEFTQKNGYRGEEINVLMCRASSMRRLEKETRSSRGEGNEFASKPGEYVISRKEVRKVRRSSSIYVKRNI